MPNVWAPHGPIKINHHSLKPLSTNPPTMAASTTIGEHPKAWRHGNLPAIVHMASPLECHEGCKPTASANPCCCHNAIWMLSSTSKLFKGRDHVPFIFILSHFFSCHLQHPERAWHIIGSVFKTSFHFSFSWPPALQPSYPLAIPWAVLLLFILPCFCPSCSLSLVCPLQFYIFHSPV